MIYPHLGPSVAHGECQSEEERSDFCLLQVDGVTTDTNCTERTQSDPRCQELETLQASYFGQGHENCAPMCNENVYCTVDDLAAYRMSRWRKRSILPRQRYLRLHRLPRMARYLVHQNISLNIALKNCIQSLIRTFASQNLTVWLAHWAIKWTILPGYNRHRQHGENVDRMNGLQRRMIKQAGNRGLPDYGNIDDGKEEKGFRTVFWLIPGHWSKLTGLEFRLHYFIT